MSFYQFMQEDTVSSLLNLVDITLKNDHSFRLSLREEVYLVEPVDKIFYNTFCSSCLKDRNDW